jgi:hypothetical protein
MIGAGLGKNKNMEIQPTENCDLTREWSRKLIFNQQTIEFQPIENGNLTTRKWGKKWRFSQHKINIDR